MDPRDEPVHISRLRLMSKSAMHYAAGFDEGSTTYAMERGSAVHHLVFETGMVKSMAEGKVRRGKEYDAFVADNPDALILTYGEGQKALAMANAVRKTPLAMRTLDGAREVLREWSIGARHCAGTPDVVGDDYVTELKTCATADPRRFVWHSLRMGYHAQLAWYLNGVRKEQAYIVAVESAPPFPVTVLRLTDRAIEMGRRMYTLWWEQLAACEAANEWPPYAQSVVELDVPDDEQTLDFGEGEAA